MIFKVICGEEADPTPQWNRPLSTDLRPLLVLYLSSILVRMGKELFVKDSNEWLMNYNYRAKFEI